MENSSETQVGRADPDLLQRICLDYICQNLDSICLRSTCPESEIPEDETGPSKEIVMDLEIALGQLHEKTNSKFSECEPLIPEKLEFLPDNDQLFLHSKLSEELLQRLSELGTIDDIIFTLFDGSKTCLRKVKIDNASKLTRYGLQNLYNHNLKDLEVSNMVKATVNDLIQCLNPWTLSNLKSLNVSNSTFVDNQKQTIVVALTKLRNLSSLNVSGTEFNTTSLDMILEDLPMLESLDISNTKVRDISALVKAKDRLKSLSVADLKLSRTGSGNAHPAEDIEVLAQLQNLKHLDISECNDNQDESLFEATVSNSLNMSDFLVYCLKALPNLISLDISGEN